MKKKYLLAMMFMCLLGTSCMSSPEEDMIRADHVQNISSGGNKWSRFLPIMDDETFSVNGLINELDAPVIASGKMFEISQVPAEPILSKFPGASLYFDQEAGFNILRDTIPYIHDKYDQSIISEKRDSLGITILEHSIDVDLKQDAAIRHLSVVFPQTPGVLKLIAMPVADVYYWRYTFTLQTDRVLLDGEEVSLTSHIKYDVNIYFNRIYDSRANKQ